MENKSGKPNLFLAVDNINRLKEHRKKLEEAHRDYLLEKIMEFRQLMITSDRYTEEDVAVYSKHFGII